MKELLSITEQDGQQLVYTRDLHQLLIIDSTQDEVSEHFNHWIKRMIAYGEFRIGIDYTIIESVTNICLSNNKSNSQLIYR